MHRSPHFPYVLLDAFWRGIPPILCQRERYLITKCSRTISIFTPSVISSICPSRIPCIAMNEFITPVRCMIPTKTEHISKDIFASFSDSQYPMKPRAQPEMGYKERRHLGAPVSRCGDIALHLQGLDDTPYQEYSIEESGRCQAGHPSNPEPY